MATKMQYTGKYKLSRFELNYAKWFSLKYPEWLEEYNTLKDSVKAITYDTEGHGAGRVYDSTGELASKRAEIRRKMLLVEHAAFDAGGESLGEYILKSVIYEHVTFEDMKASGLPCERTLFYEKRRKYYYLLSKTI